MGVPWVTGQGTWCWAAFFRSCCGAEAREVLLWCRAGVETIVSACYKLNSPIREL